MLHSKNGDKKLQLHDLKLTIRKLKCFLERWIDSQNFQKISLAVRNRRPCRLNESQCEDTDQEDYNI